MSSRNLIQIWTFYGQDHKCCKIATIDNIKLKIMLWNDGWSELYPNPLYQEFNPCYSTSLTALSTETLSPNIPICLHQSLSITILCKRHFNIKTDALPSSPVTVLPKTRGCALILNTGPYRTHTCVGRTSAAANKPSMKSSSSGTLGSRQREKRV